MFGSDQCLVRYRFRNLESSNMAAARKIWRGDDRLTSYYNLTFDICMMACCRHLW